MSVNEMIGTTMLLYGLINPVGVAPIYLSLVRRISPDRAHRIIVVSEDIIGSRGAISAVVLDRVRAFADPVIVAEVGDKSPDATSFRGSARPRACFAPSSTPTTMTPPAVLAKAMMLCITRSGDHKSRLNSRVLPSGCCIRWARLIWRRTQILHCTMR